jgi:hypothetical protein
MDYCQKVIDQFFQKFYFDRINHVINANPVISRRLDLAILKFWCSVIDFYGGIHYIGKTNTPRVNRDGSLKLAHGEAFRMFIEDYFPSPENKYGKLFYNIFRSGVVHQISPKKSGIHWEHATRKEMIWVVQNSPDPKDIIGHLNLKVFQELSYDAFQKFHEFIKNGVDQNFCENIFNHLLANPDSLGDESALWNNYNELKRNGYDIMRP